MDTRAIAVDGKTVILRRVRYVTQSPSSDEPMRKTSRWESDPEDEGECTMQEFIAMMQDSGWYPDGRGGWTNVAPR